MERTDQQFYAYYDTIEETGEVIYCGKGDNHRSDIDKSPKRNKLYNDYTKNKKVIRTRIPTLDESLALQLEDWLMEHYHTWVDDPEHTEHACNIDGPGTNGGSKTKSKESIEKQRQTMKGRESPKKGKTHAEYFGEARALEISAKISKTVIENNPIKGKTHVEYFGEERAQEISNKLSKASKGKKQLKPSSKKGKTNVELYGIEKAKEISDKITKFLIGKPLSKEFLQAAIEANNKPVVKIDKIIGEVIAQFKSITDAAEQTGICGNSISLCCRKVKLKTAGGFKWKFIEK